MPSYQRRNDPRKARKYVFFDARNGSIVFEYGGVHAPLKILQDTTQKKSESNKEIELYELGLIVDEQGKSNHGKTKLIFYVAGDFLTEKEKEQKLIFKWGLAEISVDWNNLMKSPE